MQSVLIANRGEIAVRVIRTCRDLGLRSVAIYSEADQGQMWTRLADQAVQVGGAPPHQSYLNIENILAAAKSAGVDAIHPGYGLLSESPEFAASVADAGLVFIGPSPDVISTMGDKVAARNAAMSSGVPVLPGSDGPVDDVKSAMDTAEALGWPVAVKASFGGGGRGMRVAHSADELETAMQQAAREAQGAFGRAEVFLEKFLVRPRHVEVQILGDVKGHVVHLGDRDCSVQRRHQKLIEEAPAPNLPKVLRANMQAAAIKLAHDVGYHGAGTVEFLVDREGKAFYFLEMNTRLQVEHGVTELISGVDLVAEQIRIAAGEPVSFAQKNVNLRGHAIQARVTAEDPWDDFRPTPGLISRLSLPESPWLRLDFGFQSGDLIPGFYDSLIGKVQAVGRTREEARTRLRGGLDRLRIEGVPSTAPYLASLLDQQDFITACHDTGSLERDWPADPDMRPALPDQAGPEGEAEEAARPSRTICLPWGGQLVDFTIFGEARQGGNNASIPSSPRASKRESASSGQAAPGDVTSPLDAAVVSIAANVGDVVEPGAPIVILEAMKMEVIVSAKVEGVLAAILVEPGVTVRRGAVIAEMTTKTETPS